MGRGWCCSVAGQSRLAAGGLSDRRRRADARDSGPAKLLRPIRRLGAGAFQARGQPSLGREVAHTYRALQALGVLAVACMQPRQLVPTRPRGKRKRKEKRRRNQRRTETDSQETLDCHFISCWIIVASRLLLQGWLAQPLSLFPYVCNPHCTHRRLASHGQKGQGPSERTCYSSQHFVEAHAAAWRAGLPRCYFYPNQGLNVCTSMYVCTHWGN
jgi:hypothetical protein